MIAKTDVIRAIYRQVQAPEWAGANLDGLADVLRDLSWLAPGPVVLTVPDLAVLGDADRAALLRVLDQAVVETREFDRPVRYVTA